ncbi:54S ribosomal protein L7, mitochondrial [Microbotryomycetes sp. JL221]|nr:54S ribosomal protein L7, mitochondrial [Microbotryomycetes sp. JL221]
MSASRVARRTASAIVKSTAAPVTTTNTCSHDRLQWSSGSNRCASSTAASTSVEHDQAFLRSVTPGPTHRSRLRDHYINTLSHDLMYQLYQHDTHTSASTKPNPQTRQPVWSPTNPYALNRAPPRPKGNRYIVPNPSFTSSDTVPKLERIVVQSMTKTAVGNKSALLPLIMAFETITGEPSQSKHPGPYGPGSGRGIVVTRSTKRSASFKIRGGMPTGCKVELRGPEMFEFLQILIDFVLPRLKTFNGVSLPSISHPKQSSSSTSGVVSFGFGPEAMSLFPQIESNLDQFKLFGFNVFCITSAKGRRAQDQARALMSGLGLPFVKRS